MNSCKKKKIKKIDQMTMKLISEDTLNSNLTTSIILIRLENNFSEQKNNYINNSIFHYNKIYATITKKLLNIQRVKVIEIY